MMMNKEFTRRLGKRSDEMRRSITAFRVVIWPLIIREEDYRLKDGYCRFTTLRKMGKSQALAYVGRLKMNP